MISVVTMNGRVTIPQRVREKLGINPGTRLSLAAIEGKLVGTKIDESNAFSKWHGRGKLPGRITVDAHLAKVRDGRIKIRQP